MKTIDLPSRLGQFAWRQVTPSTIALPVIFRMPNKPNIAFQSFPQSFLSTHFLNKFRHHNREEYLCVQMLNIHLLSKFSSETIAYYMNQSPIQYFSLTQSEASLLHYINQFHANGYLANYQKLDYSRLDLAYITPFIPFVHFYQLLSSNSQFIKNNAFWFASKYDKLMTGDDISAFGLYSNKRNDMLARSDQIPSETNFVIQKDAFIFPDKEKEKEHINNKYSINKISSLSPPNVCISNNSYCRSILFHEKEIMSYNTISSIDSNQTIVCLSIKDIVLTYFPSATPEEFIQLCRLKQIIRYKPDKSTNSDSSLRLINLQQLNQHWNFFVQHLSPKPQSTFSVQSQFNQYNNENSSINKSPSLTIDTCDNASNLIEQSCEDTPKTVSPPILSEHENTSSKMDLIQSIDDENLHLEINSLLNQLIKIIEEQNESIANSSENQQEESILSTTGNKNLKRKRRRSQRCFFTSKRRRRRQSNGQTQWWIKKYSIRPISILLDRVNVSID